MLAIGRRYWCKSNPVCWFWWCNSSSVNAGKSAQKPTDIPEDSTLRAFSL